MSAAHGPLPAATALRLQLLFNGYEPIPIVRHDAPRSKFLKSPGKQPLMAGWQAVEITPDLVQAWRTNDQSRHPGTGLRCGELCGVDIDVLNPDLSAEVQHLARGMLGDTPLRRVGKAPKMLLCYRSAEPVQKLQTRGMLLPDGSKAQVEIMGKGQQVVAYGIHPDTLGQYEWQDMGPDEVPLRDLPIVSPAALLAFRDAAISAIQAAGGHYEIKQEDTTETPRPWLGAQLGGTSGPRVAAAGSNFFREVNRRALADIEPWMRGLFGSKAKKRPNGAWTVDPADLGRNYENNLAVHPVLGCHDHGPEKSTSPIGIVMEFGGLSTPEDAAFWICQQVGVSPADCGWREARAKPAAAGCAKARKRQQEVAWPEPIDFIAEANVTGSPELKPEHVPAALWPFITDTAARMGVDHASVALSAIVSCASVVTDDWRLQPKQHDDTWTENPRLWGAIVGDPSILKSPIIAACTKPIEWLEIEARKTHVDNMQRYKADLKRWKDDGSDPETEPQAPKLSRFMVEGATTEALSEALRSDPEAKQTAPAGKVLVRQDEMSEFLANLDRYRAGGGGGGDRGAYLRLFNGGRYTVDRIGRGTFAIPNWSACFLGGIQPGPIQKIAQQSADDGLLQRFCYCVPGEQPEGEDRVPDAGARRRYEALIPALAALQPERNNGGEPRVIVLHAGAHEHRRSIDTLSRALMAMPDTSPRLKAAFGKWPGLFARLALTFHLIEHADIIPGGGEAVSPLVLTEATARRAASYLEYILLPHLLRAEALMFASTQTGHARWIAEFILAKGQPRVALREIVQAYRALRAPEQRRELLETMEALVTLGWLLPEDPETNRPAAWHVNPHINQTWAERGRVERERRKKAQEAMAELIRSRLRRPA